MIKKLISIFFILTLFSCEKTKFYPNYTLTKVSYVPDSLKQKHRDFIIESIRASNQHLSAGRYKNIDETIIQVKRTADDIFSAEEIGLRKCIDDNYFNCIELNRKEMNDYEIKILDNLLNK